MDVFLENNIIKTKDLDIDEDAGGLGTVLYKFIKKHGSSISQIEADTGQSETYASLLQKCARTAISLQDKGIKKGDIIALCSGHHLDACVPILAALFLGALPCSLEPSLAVPDCAHMISKIRPKIIFLQECSEELIKSCLETLNWQTDLVIFERDFETEFLSPKADEGSFKPLYVKDLQETAIVYFSSGSSGLPKAIRINHYSFVTLCSQPTSHKPLPSSESSKVYAPRSIILSYSNWYWVSSGIVLVTSIAAGGYRILVNKFEPVKLWHHIDKYKVTFLFQTPCMAIGWCDSARPKDVDTSSLKFILIGGSPLTYECISKIKKTFPGVMVSEVYGLTETGSVTRIFCGCAGEQLEKNPTAVGLPIRGVSCKVVDPESGRLLGFNQPGELRVKSRQVMNGYYNDDIETKKVFDEEGFVKTGDMLYYDEDFCFYFVQRLKDVIKYRGWNISPVVIENIFLQHPAVKDAVVIGKPDEVDGDHPMGVVILKENCDVTEDELLKFVNDRVEDRLKLRGGVKFVDSYPLGPTGKVRRYILRDIVLKK